MSSEHRGQTGMEPGNRTVLLLMRHLRHAAPQRAHIRTFLKGLAGPARRSVLRAAVDGAFVIYTLKLRGVRPLLTASVAGPSIVDVHRARSVASAVDAGLGLVPAAPTCLRRSLTLLRELRRLRLEATLHIGVRSVVGNVEAHAWVQVGDEVINDDPSVTATYATMAAGELEQLLPLLS